jgi:hypothetical protein
MSYLLISKKRRPDWTVYNGMTAVVVNTPVDTTEIDYPGYLTSRRFMELLPSLVCLITSVSSFILVDALVQTVVQRLVATHSHPTRSTI